jgi:hypothetical protein
MKIKIFLAILLGLCFPFITSLTTFAASEPSAAMIEKQKEVDKIVFEEKKQELVDKGITVTYTAPLDKSIEIGVQPYNKETINYFNELFGKDTVTVVDGQQAVTLSQTSAPVEPLTGEKTPNEKISAVTPIYVTAALIFLAGGMAILISRKKRL